MNRIKSGQTEKWTANDWRTRAQHIDEKKNANDEEKENEIINDAPSIIHYCNNVYAYFHIKRQKATKILFILFNLFFLVKHSTKLNTNHITMLFYVTYFVLFESSFFQPIEVCEFWAISMLANEYICMEWICVHHEIITVETISNIRT